MDTQVLEAFSNERYKMPQELSLSDRRRIEIVLKLVGTGEKILDIGSRDGIISRLMMKKGNSVYAADISESAVELARKNGINALHVKAEAPMPFEDGFFSALFAGEVIEHVLDTDKFIAEARRLLKPGGTLIITTPNVASLGRRIVLLLGGNPYLENTLRDYDAGHVRYFTKACLVKLLQDHKFRVKSFTSEAVNLDRGEAMQSRVMAKLFPTLGQSLIIAAERI